MKRFPAATAATALLLAAFALAACGDGSDSEGTPAVCLGEGSTYLTALASAPEQVELEGGVKISDCIVPEQSGGELGQVGSAVTEAAGRLNADAQKDPGGQAALQLGYLVGSVEQGAEDTAGIHTDLILRLNSAARENDGEKALPAEFERTFGEGYAAAQTAG